MKAAKFAATTANPELELVDKEVKALAMFTAKPIKTQPDYKQAASLLKQAKAYLKRIDTVFDPLIASAKATLDSIKAEKAVHYQPVKDLDLTLRQLSSAYIAEQEATRARLQAKLDADRAKAEAKNIARAEAGKKTRPVPQPSFVVPVDTAGISYREVWDFEITDESLVPDYLWMIDETKIASLVRAEHDAFSIPGIRVFSTKVPVVR
jgi:hypothetical protein